MDMKDAKILITGGSVGIGFETAKLLQAEGAAVVIAGRNKERLQAAAAEIACEAVQGDVGIEEDGVRMVQEAQAKLGGLNVLVNNAGIGIFGHLNDQKLADMETVFRTNVFGAMTMAREAARIFTAQRYGNILNVGSTAGDKGFGGGTAYAASKAALKSMTECWRDELRPSNVRVVLIKPSEVVTEFAQRAGYPQEDSPHKLHGLDIAYAILHALKQPDVGFIPEYPVWATNPKGL